MKLRSATKLERNPADKSGRNKIHPSESPLENLSDGQPDEMNQFSLLPPEILEKILLNLDPVDLLRASIVCNMFRRHCDGHIMWKKKCLEAGIIGS